jgi:PilZ domain
MTVDRRREPRVESSLEILIWGSDAQGMPFAQTALARNISRQGALLSGLKQALRCGDLIVVQYRKVRARFRVVWTRSNGENIQAAVQKLEGQDCPWIDELQMSSPAESAATLVP